MKKKITVGLVEDEKPFRDHFMREIGDDASIAAVCHWESAEDYLEDKRNGAVDILFIDIALPGMNGIELADLLNSRDPDFKMVMITVINTDETIFRALSAGALGYVFKEEMGDIREVIRNIMSGGAIITPSVALKVLHSFRKDRQDDEYLRLSSREKQVLELLVKGYTIRKLAGMLDISPNTIRNHVYSIYRKLNVKNKTEMMQKASRIGML